MPSTVKKGSTGADVVLCQQRLNVHGISCAVDGIFGQQTENSVIAFQRAHGLAADGIVGPLTWDALLAAPVDAPNAKDLDPLSLSMMVEIAWYIGWDYAITTPALVAQPSRLAPSSVVWRAGQKTDTVCCVFVAGVVGRVYDAQAAWTPNAWQRFMVPANDPWGMADECVAAGIGAPYTGAPAANKWYVAQGWSGLVNGQVVPGSVGHQWLQWGPDLFAEANSYTDEDADGANTDAGGVAWCHQSWSAQETRFTEVRLVELVALKAT